MFLMITSLLKEFNIVPDNETPLPDVDPRKYRLGFVLHPPHYKVRFVSRNQDVNSGVEA